MRHLLLPLVLAGCTAHAGASGDSPASGSSAAEPLELILHDPTGRPGPSQACTARLCTSLLELLQRADRTIDFAFYGLRGQPAIIEALVQAQARGVRVRGVVDRTLDGGNLYADTEALVAALGTVHDDRATDQQTAARRAAEPSFGGRCWLPRPEGFEGPLQCVGLDLGDRCLMAAHASRSPLTFDGDIMHDKFAVVDGRWVWMGSTNVSDSGTGGYNANLAAVWDHDTIASWYTHELDQLWQGTAHADKPRSGPLELRLTPTLAVEAGFSPQDQPLSRLVRPLLQQARERIDVAIFFLTHKGVAADLVAAHRRGVAVRVLLDATAATNAYTKHELLRLAGIPVKVEAWGGKMHMKAAAIDGETVITGSMNWTSAGESGNDENTIVVRSEPHAAAFHAFYDRIWHQTPERWLTGQPDPESSASPPSCTDGADNDYDGLADAHDPGCGPHPPAPSPLPPARIVPKTEGEGVLVKGTTGPRGEAVYLTPAHPLYASTQVQPVRGDRWFCSEEDARDAGYRTARRR